MTTMRFKDFVTLQRGFDLPKHDLEEGPYPVVGSTSVIGYHNAFKVQPPGVVMGRSGSLGTIQLVKEPFWPHNTSLWVKDFKGNEPIFVYYRLQGLDFARFNAGAGVPTLNRNHLDNLEVEVPPVPVQRRIASVLAAYDDLVERNVRRIRILDEIARALYREWFLRFRFPGREKVALAASPVGPIPQGWELRRLGEVAAVNRAQLSARTAPAEIRYIDISSVSPGHIEASTTYAFAGAPSRARRIVQHGDILWSCVRPNRRSHALVVRPSDDVIASTGFAVLTATKVPFAFLYLATTTDEFVAYLSNHATGAAYPAVTAKTFEDAEILYPPQPLLKVFGDTVTPMVEQIHVLQQQNQNLRRIRSLLLPRLLSGQVVPAPVA